MSIPPPPIDFTGYDVAKAAYDTSEVDYKVKSGVRDIAQVEYDQAQAALEQATSELETSNAQFQQDLSTLVTECDVVGVSYPPDMTPPTPPVHLPTRR